MEDVGRARTEGPFPFGKYLLDAELAQGGMSRVFEARLRGPGGFEKKLVVKQILPQLAQDPSFIELFVREANTLVQMSHPNVVPVYELGVVDGVYFLAMERVHGATVAELLRDGPLPEALVAQLGAQICEALRYAHERFGLVHRDVTPRNVIIDRDGHVRLLDFGIAAPSAQTGRGELFGSPGYMSPEQAARCALTPQSDLYGVGAVLYEALTARRASERPHDVPEPCGQGEISVELSGLVARLLAQDPIERPTAGEAAVALRTWLARNHPEGVQGALGARVEQAGRHVPRSVSVGDSVPPSTATGAAPAPPGTRRMTRSLATSKSLASLIAETTEALPGRASPARAPHARPRARGIVTALGLLGGLLALVVAAAMRAQWHTSSPQAPSPAVESTPRTTPAPVEPVAVPAEPMLAPVNAPAVAVSSAVETPASATAGAIADEPEATPVAGSSADSAAAAPSELSINATPWATVRLDGHELGTTPQRGLQVRAGPHVLSLECPPLGRHARVPLRLSAGDHRRVLVDMQVDPPRVSVR